ncbi:MAG TPA: stringent starvation protein A [Coxiellaceae bacterium]|nr:stringent starvation protein A [Coxiellaceae bacterium]
MALKHSTMVLYSDALDIASHRTRIVLAEKGIAVNIIYVDSNNPPEDLLTINPYNTLPTLVDRDLVLYEAGIITEYLDERFPHPPLLPVYPVARAKCRLMIHRIEHDWLTLINIIQKGKKNEADDARKNLRGQLITIAPVFSEAPYFLSEDFTLADCCLAPMLWRLISLGVELPSQTKPIGDYMNRLFARDSFKASLSELERELRD